MLIRAEFLLDVRRVLAEQCSIRIVELSVLAVVVTDNRVACLCFDRMTVDNVSTGRIDNQESLFVETFNAACAIDSHAVFVVVEFILNFVDSKRRAVAANHCDRRFVESTAYGIAVDETRDLRDSFAVGRDRYRQCATGVDCNVVAVDSDCCVTVVEDDRAFEAGDGSDAGSSNVHADNAVFVAEGVACAVNLELTVCVGFNAAGVAVDSCVARHVGNFRHTAFADYDVELVVRVLDVDFSAVDRDITCRRNSSVFKTSNAVHTYNANEFAFIINIERDFAVRYDSYSLFIDARIDGDSLSSFNVDCQRAALQAGYAYRASCVCVERECRIGAGD